MRRIWKYTVDKMRNVWNCEHTLKIAMLRKAVDLYKGAVFMYGKEQA